MPGDRGSSAVQVRFRGGLPCPESTPRPEPVHAGPPQKAGQTVSLLHLHLEDGTGAFGFRRFSHPDHQMTLDAFLMD